MYVFHSFHSFSLVPHSLIVSFVQDVARRDHESWHTGFDDIQHPLRWPCFPSLRICMQSYELTVDLPMSLLTCRMFHWMCILGNQLNRESVFSVPLGESPENTPQRYDPPLGMRTSNEITSLADVELESRDGTSSFAPAGLDPEIRQGSNPGDAAGRSGYTTLEKTAAMASRAHPSGDPATATCGRMQTNMTCCSSDKSRETHQFIPHVH